MRLGVWRKQKVRTCPKCAGGYVSVTFRAGGGGFKDPGRLECYCRGCTFRWYEPTADSKDGAGA